MGGFGKKLLYSPPTPLDTITTRLPIFITNHPGLPRIIRNQTSHHISSHRGTSHGLRVLRSLNLRFRFAAVADGPGLGIRSTEIRHQFVIGFGTCQLAFLPLRWAGFPSIRNLIPNTCPPRLLIYRCMSSLIVGLKADTRNTLTPSIFSCNC